MFRIKEKKPALFLALMLILSVGLIAGCSADAGSGVSPDMGADSVTDSAIQTPQAIAADDQATADTGSSSGQSGTSSGSGSGSATVNTNTGSGTNNNSGSGNSGNSYIGEAAAKNKALAHAGFTAGQVSRLHVEFDYDDGIAEYEVGFYVGMYEYDYEINAVTGAIISFEKDYDD